MKRIILVSIILVMISTVAHAQNYTCLDNQTSQFETTLIVSGSSIPIQYNETCKFGCNDNTGRCYESNIFDIGAAVVLSIVAFLLLFMGTRMDTSQWAIQLLLLGVSLLFLIADIGIIQKMSEISGSHTFEILLGVYSTIIWASLLIVMYFLLIVIIKAVNVLQGKKGK